MSLENSMQLPSKKLENKLFKKGFKYIVGVDEVGAGPLAGPVVVCATLFDKKFYSQKHEELFEVRDSKLLSSKKRQELSDRILESKIRYQIGSCSPEKIDRINIFQAIQAAMRMAVFKLVKKYKIKPKQVMVLLDGRNLISNLDLAQQAIVKGDRKVFAISCASIIAKVKRDKIMDNYSKKYSNYGFEKHKGYGTKDHFAKLRKYGLCPIHRKSFCRNLHFSEARR